MERIAGEFRKRFRTWKLELPARALLDRRPGFFQAEGWLIQYAFGRNEQGDYLDYYATHRMAGDSHLRLYATGECEDLPALSTSHLTSDDPVEARRLEQEFYERNRTIANELGEKGFNKFTINMMLSMEEERERP